MAACFKCGVKTPPGARLCAYCAQFATRGGIVMHPSKAAA